ncbi:Rgg family transcriptional regulator [Streptococcus suis]
MVSIAGKLSLKIVPHLSSSIKNEEIQQILDYFGTIETWGKFELTIFAFTLTHCPHEMLYRIRKLIEFVSTTELSKERIISCLELFLWAILYYSKNGYFDEAHYVIHQVEKFLDRDRMFYLTHFRVHILSVKATTLLRQNDLKGLIYTKKVLDFFKCCSETFQDYRVNQYHNDYYMVLT